MRTGSDRDLFVSSRKPNCRNPSYVGMLTFITARSYGSYRWWERPSRSRLPL